MLYDHLFCGCSKQTFNCSPHRYLADKRLEKARQLLHDDHDPIVSIAYDCGFADIHAFSKAFKKKFGRNPSAELQHSKPTVF